MLSKAIKNTTFFGTQSFMLIAQQNFAEFWLKIVMYIYINYVITCTNRNFKKGYCKDTKQVIISTLVSPGKASMISDIRVSIFENVKE